MTGRRAQADPADLVLAGKSRWHPAIRREHALARGAGEAGLRVRFVEHPLDIRALRTGQARRFLTGLLTSPEPHDVPGAPVSLRRRSSLAPGHRGGLAARADQASLLAALRTEDPAATVVVTTPWQWPAAARAPHRRRVADLADDWTALVPRAATAVRDWHRRIADGADEIVVASAGLLDLFPGRRPHLVRNATDAALLALPPTPAPRAARLGYVGTLSERFDAPLLTAVLDRLPGWHLELWGGCRYAGCGDRPGPELARLLELGEHRVRWRGPVERGRLGAVLDRADVLVLPNRPEVAAGQDSMKLYDYAARGRPVVATALPPGTEHPPGLRERAGPADWADAVLDCARELSDPDTAARAAARRRAWAAGHTWAQRMPHWLAVVQGTDRPAGGRSGPGAGEPGGHPPNGSRR